MVPVLDVVSYWIWGTGYCKLLSLFIYLIFWTLGLWACSCLGLGFLRVGLWNLDFAYREFCLDFGSWFLILAVWYRYWIKSIYIFLIFWTLGLWACGMFLFRLGFWVLGCGIWILPIRSWFWKFYNLVSILNSLIEDTRYHTTFTHADPELLSTDLAHFLIFFRTRLRIVSCDLMILMKWLASLQGSLSSGHRRVLEQGQHPTSHKVG